MNEQYQHTELEAAVQKKWADSRAFEVTEDEFREKYYCLAMLPYPSGALHMGHVRNYTIGDVIARYQRMQGKNVLQPVGWDAFGLPAENAAIKHQVPPAEWTYQNIDHMRDQLKGLGYAYDWSREFTTCTPEYYHWEQLMFTRLMQRGVAYRKNSVVNWDPVDQTVLANEQVVNGRGWRSGAMVERREIPQWFLKITDYADELLYNLDDMDGWPDAVKTMQRNWIGRSEGAQFSMAVTDEDGTPLGDHRIEVYTTRPDTGFGMTYAVLSPEHPLVDEITTDGQRAAVDAFIESIAGTTDTDRQASDAHMDKRGVFTGAYVLNPFNNTPVPLFLADYVLMSYGTGAIMAVPAQDERDHEFATQHNLPIVRTVQPPENFDGDAWTGEGITINSAWLNGLNVEDAKAKALDWLDEQGIGKRQVNYRLRDWGVSRQRYWGCPIPVIYCDDCGAVPVPEDQLPVILPEDVEFMGVQSPIKADPEWRKTTCPTCGKAAERETDTFDTFMESSWYYARYCSPGATDLVDERADYWLPIDQYIGGIEHAILHLMYFRFYHKLMRDAGLVKSDEPVNRMMCQGMVIAETWYQEDADGQPIWINPADIDIVTDERGRVTGGKMKGSGAAVILGAVEKMSKSKNNGVDPNGLITTYGADTVRLFSVFGSPPEQSMEWSDSGVEGAYRFLKRIWTQLNAHLEAFEPAQLNVSKLNESQKALRFKLHQTIAKVGDDIERRYTFNTAIAAVMELVNLLVKQPMDDPQDHAVTREAWTAITLMLQPMVPHITDAMWQALGQTESILDAKWPVVDESAMVQDQIDMVIQVNGKLRGKVTVAPGTDKATVEALAMADPNVQRFIEGQTVRKVIVVPNRLVNIVATP